MGETQDDSFLGDLEEFCYIFAKEFAMTELNEKLFLFSYQVIQKFTEDISDFFTEEIEEELHTLVDVETRDIIEKLTKSMADRIKTTIAVQKVIEDEDEDEDEDEEDRMEDLENWCAMLDKLDELEKQKQGADGPVPEQVEKGGVEEVEKEVPVPVPEEVEKGVEMQEIEKVVVVPVTVPQEVEKEDEKGGSVPLPQPLEKGSSSKWGKNTVDPEYDVFIKNVKSFRTYQRELMKKKTAAQKVRKEFEKMVKRMPTFFNFPRIEAKLKGKGKGKPQDEDEDKPKK